MLRRRLFLSLICSAGAFAQNPEAGRVERNGSEATLLVDSPRPVDAAAITMAQEFGIRVSVEDPPYIWKDDIQDVTAEVSRDARRPVRIPKGGHENCAFRGIDQAPQENPARE